MARYTDDDKAYGKLPRKLKKKLPKGQANKSNDLKIAQNTSPQKETMGEKLKRIKKTKQKQKELIDDMLKNMS
tara:strand:- start:74 stop:292 length:219 start_codon:yes stop_codon:yes gene_type:complete